MPILEYRKSNGARVTVSPDAPLPTYNVRGWETIANTVATLNATTERTLMPQLGIFDTTPYITIGFTATVTTANKTVTIGLAHYHTDYYGDIHNPNNPDAFRAYYDYPTPIDDLNWYTAYNFYPLALNRCVLYRLPHTDTLQVRIIVWGRY